MPKAPTNRIPQADTRFTDQDTPGDGKLEEGEEFTSLEGLTYPDDDKKPEGQDPAADAAGDGTAPEGDASDGEDDIPPELKAKSSAELAKMYREAQSLIGRQGRELGESRKLLDGFVKQTLAEREAEKRAKAAAEGTVADAKPDAVDFFADPEKAVERAIAAHPVLKQLQGEARQLAAREIVRTQQSNMAEFQKLHPDAPKIMQDPAFRQWVAASPVRQQLLMRADKSYDLVAGNEVFSLWKEIRGIGRQAAAPDAGSPEGKRRQAERSAARVPGGGGRPAAKGGSKPILKRAEIVRMMAEDPARYEAMADEIALAYAEKRVR